MVEAKWSACLDIGLEIHETIFHRHDSFVNSIVSHSVRLLTDSLRFPPAA